MLSDKDNNTKYSFTNFCVNWTNIQQTYDLQVFSRAIHAQSPYFTPSVVYWHCCRSDEPSATSAHVYLVGTDYYGNKQAQIYFFSEAVRKEINV